MEIHKERGWDATLRAVPGRCDIIGAGVLARETIALYCADEMNWLRRERWETVG